MGRGTTDSGGPDLTGGCVSRSTLNHKLRDASFTLRARIRLRGV